MQQTGRKFKFMSGRNTEVVVCGESVSVFHKQRLIIYFDPFQIRLSTFEFDDAIKRRISDCVKEFNLPINVRTYGNSLEVKYVSRSGTHSQAYVHSWGDFKLNLGSDQVMEYIQPEQVELI